MFDKVKQIIQEEKSWVKIWERLREEFKDVPETELKRMVIEARAQLAEESNASFRTVITGKNAARIVRTIEEERAFVEDVRSLEQTDLDAATKRGVLEALLRKCIERVRLLETLQQESLQAGSPLDSKLEQCLLAYMKEARELIESYLNLSEELREDESGFVVKTISQVMQRLLFIIAQTLREVFGESDPRIEVFKQKLKERLPRVAED